MKPIFLVAASIPLALTVSIAAAPLEWSLYDARLSMRADGGWPDDLVSVPIDEPTLGALGGWPLPAESAASLLDAVHAAGAETIVFDVFLGHVGGPDDDARLAASLARTVTAVTFRAEDGRPPTEEELLRATLAAGSGPEVERARLAFPPPRIVAGAARLGHAGFRAGGAIRSSPPLVRITGSGNGRAGDQALPSQALAALIEHRRWDPGQISAAGGGITLPGGRRVPLFGGETLLDLVPGGPAPREIAAASLLDGSVLPGALDGALAVVHVDTPEDRHRSPLGDATPGGLLLASAIRTLDLGRAPRIVPLWAAVLVCAGLVLTALRVPHRTTRFATVAACESAWLAAAFAMVPIADVFLPLLGPLVVFALGIVAAIGNTASAGELTAENAENTEKKKE